MYELQSTNLKTNFAKQFETLVDAKRHAHRLVHGCSFETLGEVVEVTDDNGNVIFTIEKVS